MRESLPIVKNLRCKTTPFRTSLASADMNKTPPGLTSVPLKLRLAEKIVPQPPRSCPPKSHRSTSVDNFRPSLSHKGARSFSVNHLSPRKRPADSGFSQSSNIKSRVDHDRDTSKRHDVSKSLKRDGAPLSNNDHHHHKHRSSLHGSSQSKSTADHRTRKSEVVLYKDRGHTMIQSSIKKSDSSSHKSDNHERKAATPTSTPYKSDHHYKKSKSEAKHKMQQKEILIPQEQLETKQKDPRLHYRSDNDYKAKHAKEQPLDTESLKSQLKRSHSEIDISKHQSIANKTPSPKYESHHKRPKQMPHSFGKDNDRAKSVKLAVKQNHHSPSVPVTQTDQAQRSDTQRSLNGANSYQMPLEACASDLNKELVGLLEPRKHRPVMNMDNIALFSDESDDMPIKRASQSKSLVKVKKRKTNTIITDDNLDVLWTRMIERVKKNGKKVALCDFEKSSGIYNRTDDDDIKDDQLEYEVEEIIECRMINELDTYRVRYSDGIVSTVLIKDLYSCLNLVNECLERQGIELKWKYSLDDLGKREEPLIIDPKIQRNTKLLLPNRVIYECLKYFSISQDVHVFDANEPQFYRNLINIGCVTVEDRNFLIFKSIDHPRFGYMEAIMDPLNTFEYRFVDEKFQRAVRPFFHHDTIRIVHQTPQRSLDWSAIELLSATQELTKATQYQSIDLPCHVSSPKIPKSAFSRIDPSFYDSFQIAWSNLRDEDKEERCGWCGKAFDGEDFSAYAKKSAHQFRYHQGYSMDKQPTPPQFPCAINPRWYTFTIPK